jgi:hypothetical protein
MPTTKAHHVDDEDNCIGDGDINATALVAKEKRSQDWDGMVLASSASNPTRSRLGAISLVVLS